MEGQIALFLLNRALKLKLTERFNYISKYSFIRNILSRLRPRGANFKNLQTKVFAYQRVIANFIKEHRTVKILHALRRYSAMVVVISSAILVVSTNLAAGKGSSGFLFGYWGDSENSQSPKANKISPQISTKNDLAMVSLSKALTSPEVEIKEDEDQNIIQGQSLMVASNLPLRDPEEEGGVKIYTVKEGDTVSQIAEKNNITVNTILWANDVDNVDSIMPGDKLFILPVAGLSYTVKKGDDLDSIAKKYSADKNSIIAFNDLPADGALKEDESIIIPGGRKEVPVPSAAESNRRQYATPLGGAPSVSGWRTLSGKAGTGHKFPYGYCTWYVAQRRYVPWGGNAGAWLYNAKSAGYKTGKSPSVGAIIVTSESWWGHVGIVEKVGGGSVTIAEMNYKGWGKVDRRTLSTSSRVIKGYIY